MTPLHWVETGVAGRLAIMARPRAADWLDDEVRDMAREGVSIVVSLLEPDEVRELGLEDEPHACARAGLEFRTFPIRDRDVPPRGDATNQFIVSLRDALVSGRNVAVHCRMGIGRSSLVAASTLRLLGVPAELALERLCAARGLTVPDTRAQRAWILDFRLDSFGGSQVVRRS